MKKFAFSLSEILNVEELKKNEFTGILSELREKKRIKENEKRILEETVTSHTKKFFGSNDSMNICYINEYLKYKEVTDLKVLEFLKKIEVISQEIENIMLELIECNKRIDILEKLKEKQRDEYNFELSKSEEDLIQQIIDNKYIYNNHKTGD